MRDGTFASHPAAGRLLIEGREPCRCRGYRIVETLTTGNDIISGFVELQALTWAHQLLNKGIHLTKAPLQINAFAEDVAHKRRFQKLANNICYRTIGLQRLLFDLVHGERCCAKKTE